MTKIAHYFKPLVAACFAIACFSCNNDGEKKDEKGPAEIKSTDAPAAFKPFKLMVVKHKVANFAKWEAGYLAHDSIRNAFGISKYRLGRGLEDSNMVIVINIITDIAKTKEFIASPGLKKAMENSGVVGAPSISFLDVVRNDSSMIDQKERLIVSHKVKDYDTWLKAFDNEGTATRKSFGLMDRALARGIEDANMVYVAFAITDMEKAKARSASPEMKKIMTDAGVTGTPDIFMYRIVQ